MGSTRCRRRRAAHRPAASIPVLLSLLLSGLLLLILGAAAPGGTDTGPTIPSLGPAPAHTAAPGPAAPGQDTDGPSMAAVAPDAIAGACGEDERPREREGVGHTQVRLCFTVSDTRLLHPPDDLAQRCLDHPRATAAVRPRGHDGRPRASRVRATGDTTALLQVFRC